MDSINGGPGNNELVANDAPASMRGWAGDDTLTGSRYGDYLDGGTGSDVLFGGMGNDYYFVHDALDVVVEMAGEGHDLVFAYVNFTLSQNIEEAELVQGSGGRRLFGRDDGERLWGNSARNTLLGNGGDDRLYGGAGDDVLKGGTGADVLTGDHDEDGSGAAGNDRLFGEEGNDFLSGGAANDTLYGGDGNDKLDGDSLFSTDPSGDDRLYGENGDDYLHGFDGSDFLDGGDGNDTLDGDAGPDTLVGGNGNDCYIVLDDTDLVVESGTGIDSVDSFLNWTLSARIENLYAYGERGVGNALGNEISASDVNNFLAGGGGDDILLAKGGDDELKGGTGNDLLHGGAGIDVMKGGEGNDTYVIDDSDDRVIEAAAGGNDLVVTYIDYTLRANFENLVLGGAAVTGIGNANANHLRGNTYANLLDGQGGDDTLEGTAGDDTLQGGSGNDTLNGGAGNNRLDGGSGADVFVINRIVAAGAEDTLVSFESGIDQFFLYSGAFAGLTSGALGEAALNVGALASDADDRILYDNVSGALYFDADGSGEQAAVRFAIILDKPQHVLAADFFVSTEILFDRHDDEFHGGTGNDTLEGGTGDDSVYGGSGDDELYGDMRIGFYADDAVAGNNLVSGGDGDDRIFGGAGQDTLNGDGGNDVIRAAIHDQHLRGIPGGHEINGGEGNDTLIGGAGSDLLSGGGGDDQLYGDQPSTGSGPIGQDWLDGGDGNDTLIGSQTAGTLSGGAGNDELRGSSGADWLDGGDGDDELWALGNYPPSYGGGPANDTLLGGAGNDRLYGDKGNDVLRGGDGNDYVSGSDGNDSIYGGDGADTLYGGNGADRFYFDTAPAPANIDSINYDFVGGTDKLMLDQLIFDALSIGVLNASAFRIGTAAVDADDRFIYNTQNGALYYDADGNGAEISVQFATIIPRYAAPLLSAGDIEVY